MKDHRECFAYSNGKCSALNVKKCQGIPCNFHKTKEEAYESLRKSSERRMKLTRLS